MACLFEHVTLQLQSALSCSAMDRTSTLEGRTCMFRVWKLHPWCLVALCWAVVLGASGSIPMAQGQPAARSQVRLMFLFQGPDQERNAAVENALTRVFQRHGYSVID